MPRDFDIPTDAEIGLDECISRLGHGGFDAHDEASLLHAATALKQLSNNRTFLGDIILEELKSRHASDPAGRKAETNYGAQVVMLSRPASNFYIRANIWPAPCEYIMRASSAAPFYYDLPHDHNFNFLTVGYWGPGYWSDYYEYDYETVAGYAGESVALKDCGTKRLEQGQVMLYRAHRDIHVQRPADSLSVSLNIMQMSQAQGWHDQYRFDIENGTIAGILSHGPSDVLLHLAVSAGGDNGRDLAETFAADHPSDRMKWSAFSALAGLCTSEQERQAHFERGLSDESALVRGQSRRLLDADLPSE